MGLLDRLFGRRPPTPRAAVRPSVGSFPDDQAIARYRYLLRTAPPEQIEQAHAEAFAQLTPDQRQQVLAQLAAAVPAGERPRTDDPRTLARVATRAELRQPGFLERTLGGSAAAAGYGPGYGGGYGAGYGAGLRRRLRRRDGHGQHDRRQPARHRRRPGHRHGGRRRPVRHRPR